MASESGGHSLEPVSGAVSIVCSFQRIPRTKNYRYTSTAVGPKSCLTVRCMQACGARVYSTMFFIFPSLPRWLRTPWPVSAEEFTRHIVVVASRPSKTPLP